MSKGLQNIKVAYDFSAFSCLHSSTISNVPWERSGFAQVCRCTLAYVIILFLFFCLLYVPPTCIAFLNFLPPPFTLSQPFFPSLPLSLSFSLCLSFRLFLVNTVNWKWVRLKVEEADHSMLHVCVSGSQITVYIEVETTRFQLIGLLSHSSCNERKAERINVQIVI